MDSSELFPQTISYLKSFVNYWWQMNSLLLVFQKCEYFGKLFQIVMYSPKL